MDGGQVKLHPYETAVGTQHLLYVTIEVTDNHPIQSNDLVSGVNIHNVMSSV